MARGVGERLELMRGVAINNNAMSVDLATKWPTGENWHKMVFAIDLAVVIGTGTTPIANGELQIIKGLLLKGKVVGGGEEVIIDNVPGLPLYFTSTRKQEVQPYRDPIADATATYTVLIPIYFANSMKSQESLNPTDTALITKRYDSLEFRVNLGGLADLFSVPGTATLAATVSAYAYSQRGDLPSDPKDPRTPKFYKHYMIAGPVNPSAGGSLQIDLERRTDMIYQNLGVFAMSGAAAGVPFSGVFDDSIINELKVEQTSPAPFEVQNPWNLIEWDKLVRMQKDDYAQDQRFTGLVFIDYTLQDGSLESSNPAITKSVHAIKWSNKAGLPANPQVSVLAEGIRPFKGPSVPQ